MKKLNIIILIIVVTLLISALLMYIKAGSCGDFLYNNKYYSAAEMLYKVEFNKGGNKDALEKLCSTLLLENDLKQAINYQEKLLQDESYLKSKGESFADLNRRQYLEALFESNQKKKFKEAYYININKFHNRFIEECLLMNLVLDSTKSQKEDYEFALKGFIELLKDSQAQDNNNLIILYGGISKLYGKLGDANSAEVYKSKLKEFVESLNK